MMPIFQRITEFPLTSTRCTHGCLLSTVHASTVEAIIQGLLMVVIACSTRRKINTENKSKRVLVCVKDYHE